MQGAVDMVLQVFPQTRFYTVTLMGVTATVFIMYC
jgi:hypothetical protein